jgi:probable blue pigment (indigoidine) exporter
MAGAALMSLDASFHLGWGEWITLLGALSYAMGVAWTARLGEDVDPMAIAFVQSLAIALVLLPRAPLAMSQLGALDGAGWARFGYLAIAGSLIAPLLQFHALRAIPAGRVGLLLGLEPVFALAFATTFGAERFVLRWWLGAALILSAVLLVEWRAAAEPRARVSAIPGSAAKPSGPGGS